jgi:hypothetical protein
VGILKLRSLDPGTSLSEVLLSGLIMTLNLHTLAPDS